MWFKGLLGFYLQTFRILPRWLKPNFDYLLQPYCADETDRNDGVYGNSLKTALRCSWWNYNWLDKNARSPRNALYISWHTQKHDNQLASWGISRFRHTYTIGEAPANCILYQTNLSQLTLGLNFFWGRDKMEQEAWAVPTKVFRKESASCIPWQYTRCCNHVLNLVVHGTSQRPSIRNALWIMLLSICAYISRSALRAAGLREFVHMETLTSRRKSNLYLCAKLAG